MMKPPTIIRFVILFCVLALAGCKPGVPREIIQPGDMEDILYDYHVADGIPYISGDYKDISYWRQVYRDAVLRKHGVTEAELDSSLIYYYRHTELLHDIYQRLSKRLNNDAIALGATASELSQYEGLSSLGDTTTVWKDAQSLALIPVAPYNTFTFEITADSSYHEGDKMIMSFDNQYIFQEGMRDGMVMMAVTFKNDSTASQVLRVVTDNHYTMQIADDDRIGIKQIRGFFYLGKGADNNNNPQTLKLMCVSNLKLVRMHTSPPEQKGEGEDSVPQKLQPLDKEGISVQTNEATHPPIAREAEGDLPPKDDGSPNADRPKRVFERPTHKLQ